MKSLLLQEEIAKDLLSGDYEEETQSSADDLTPSVTSHEATDFFPRTLRCEKKIVFYVFIISPLYSALTEKFPLKVNSVIVYSPSCL